MTNRVQERIKELAVKAVNLDPDTWAGDNPDNSLTKGDEECVKEYGVTLPDLRGFDMLNSTQIRYRVNRLVREGRLLRHVAQSGGADRYWPVGLAEELIKS